MLDLSASPQDFSGVTVVPDTSGPGSWILLPGPPQVSAGPDLQLLRFSTDGALSGGYLRLGFDLSVDDAAITSATSALTDGRAGKPVTLTPLELLGAEADLSFFGPDPATPAGAQSALVATSYATTLLDVNPPHHGVFAVELTAAGVQLVESGLRAGTVPIGVQCRLTAEGLWPSARVTAQVDWSSVYNHFSSEYKQGDLLVGEDVKQLVQQLVQSRAIQVTAVESTAPGSDPSSDSAAISAALAFIQTDLIDQFCQPLLPLRTDPAQASLGDAGDLLDLGAAYEVKAEIEIETATAYYDFQQSTVIQRVLSSMTALGDLLGGADPSSVIVDVGPLDPFFKQFHLDCTTARPLAASHLSDAVLDVEYGSSAGSIHLTDDAPSGGFDSFADASADGSWTMTPRVTFAADSPVDPGVLVQLPAQSGTARATTLDFDAALGLVHIDIEGSTDIRIAGTMLNVTAASGGNARATSTVTLLPTKPTAQVWFRDHRPGDSITASGQHLLADGRQLPIPELSIDTTTFRLPDPLVGTITVQIVTDATWVELSHVEVTIQKDSSSPARTFAFDAPGTAAVSLDQLDPTDRTYRYQVSRVVAGVTTQDEWLVSDLPILAVGRVSADQLVVDVEPVGPELPAAGLRVVQVDLLYIDAPHQLRVEQTHIIEAKSDTYEWVVPIVDPTVRSYQYQITKTLLAGGQVSSGWLDSADPILTIPLTTT